MIIMFGMLAKAVGEPVRAPVQVTDAEAFVNVTERCSPSENVTMLEPVTYGHAAAPPLTDANVAAVPVGAPVKVIGMLTYKAVVPEGIAPPKSVKVDPAEAVAEACSTPEGSGLTEVIAGLPPVTVPVKVPPTGLPMVYWYWPGVRERMFSTTE
jgi:hypothetical protein